jgi:mRNA-capping enzyme
MSIDAAIDIFSKARSPGIYKQDYLNELLKKLGDESSVTITAPVRPEWCNSKKGLFPIGSISKSCFSSEQ